MSNGIDFHARHLVSAQSGGRITKWLHSILRSLLIACIAPFIASAQTVRVLLNRLPTSTT
jgi:hypothetical protein